MSDYALPPDVVARIEALTPYQRTMLLEADKRVRARCDVDDATIDWHAVIDNIQKTCTPWHAQRDVEYKKWLKKLSLGELMRVKEYMESPWHPEDWTVKSLRQALHIKTR